MVGVNHIHSKVELQPVGSLELIVPVYFPRVVIVPDKIAGIILVVE